MLKDSSVKHFQDNKEKVQIKLVRDMKVFFKIKKKKTSIQTSLKR